MISSDVLASSIQAIAKGRAEYEYFFANLTSPEWLIPLLDGGFFQHPPAPIRKGETIAFPFWPESRYLARMASVQGAEGVVLRVALQVPETENVYVNEDLADAALALPATAAAKLARRLGIAATKHPYRMLLPKKVGSLIGHLARGGQRAAALDLARTVLAVEPDRRHETNEELKDVLGPEPKPLIDGWSYGEILRLNGPDLIAGTGLDGLRLLSDLLDDAIRLSRRPDDAEPPEDYSHIWRPAIEWDRFADRVIEMLVSAVRDASVSLSQADPSVLPSEVAMLETRQWWVFRRLVLHLLRVVGNTPTELLASRVENEELWNRFPREYALLLQASATRIPEAALAKLLEWIDVGPDVEAFRIGHERLFGETPSANAVDLWAARWRLERLAPLKDALPPAWRERYEALVGTAGQPDAPGSVETSSVWVGPTSPKSDQELAAMSVGDVVAYLRTWHGAELPRGPSPEGLGRVLSTVVARNPAPFVQGIDQLLELDPTYVRSVIQGLEQAVKDKVNFAWEPVLRMLDWVVRQPVQIPGRVAGHGDYDPSWAWARTAAARLLDTGLQQDLDVIPFTARESVWRVLRPLTEDPEPTPEQEGELGGSNMDPLTLSINTTRGEALHAAVRYGLWVRGSLKAEEAARGFAEIPELRDALERRLKTDPSLAIRAVFGKWFPWLTQLDSDWAKARTDHIFPSNDRLRQYFRAAWDAFIVYSRPYNAVFGALRGVYGQAIELISRESSETRAVNDPDRHLAEHLIVFYGRGRLKIGDEDRLLERFFERGGDALRGYALSFVGRDLSESPPVPQEVIERFMLLWAWRLDAARLAGHTESFKDELGAIGWWFESGCFDADWALTQVLEALAMGAQVDPDHRVAKRLRETVLTRPLESVRCLAGLIDADKEGWSFPAWKEDAEEVLARALKSGRGQAQELATDVIHRLGAKGHWEFRKLLAEAPSKSE